MKVHQPKIPNKLTQISTASNPTEIMDDGICMIYSVFFTSILTSQKKDHPVFMWRFFLSKSLRLKSVLVLIFTFFASLG